MVKKRGGKDNRSKEDKEFSKRIKRAWADVDAGRVHTYAPPEEFLKHLHSIK